MKVKDKEAYNAYMKSYMLSRYHARMKQAKLQLGGKCTKCNKTEDLQFDHIDPNTKTETIAKFSSMAETIFQEELAKCQLLCKKCHEEKTLVDLKQQSAKVTHGTLSSYRYCKCDLCRSAKAAYMKKYKQMKRKT